MYTSGSSFLARVSFPIAGNQALVATVAATLTNRAGQVQTGTLTFQ
jgi:adhesin HecA-like repeat protein